MGKSRTNILLSNNYRPLKIFTTIILLLSLGFYALQVGRSADQVRYNETVRCLETASTCLGKTFVLRIIVFSSSANETVGGIMLKRGLKRRLRLVNLPLEMEPGSVVDVLGSFDSQGFFYVRKHSRYSWVRAFKFSVSILGFVLSVVLLFSEYRFSPATFFPLVRK